MSRSAVSNLLRLLDLSETVQQELCSGKITAGHARALVTLSEADQLRLCKQIVEGGLTVRATEAPQKRSETASRRWIRSLIRMGRPAKQIPRVGHRR
ncbi:MAG: hypothetical protein CM1200mP2_32450 [Planctomycetaceae bacterium]|nr:MAG: hypothetical protein CM1200mP2_32450 [Planctomycetaceae bacterium]